MKPSTPRLLAFMPSDFPNMIVSRKDDVNVVLEIHKDDVESLIEKLKRIAGK